MVVIRQVKVSDAQALSALLSQLDDETPFMAMGEHNSAAEISNNLALFVDAQTQVFYVIEQDGRKLLGFAIGITGYISGDSNTASLVIGIQQASIGKGLGRQLLAHVEGWARLHKLNQLELAVMKDNKNAIVFYKNKGFKQITTKPSKVIDDLTESDLYMVKRLIRIGDKSDGLGG